MAVQGFTGTLAEARGGGRFVAPREVAVPAELGAVLDSQGLRETYDGLAFTHRREYAEWVGSAKKPETRERRAAKAAEMLRAGIRRA